LIPIKPPQRTGLGGRGGTAASSNQARGRPWTSVDPDQKGSRLALAGWSPPGVRRSRRSSQGL